MDGLDATPSPSGAETPSPAVGGVGGGGGGVGGGAGGPTAAPTAAPTGADGSRGIEFDDHNEDGVVDSKDDLNGASFSFFGRWGGRRRSIHPPAALHLRVRSTSALEK